MDKTIVISEMQKFHFGSRIVYADGEDGVLTHVVCDPTTRRLTHIGVRQSRFFGKTVLVSYEAVVDASSNAISLRVKHDEAVTASNASVGGVTLDSKSAVVNGGAAGRGTLILVAVHPQQSGKLAYMVVHHLRSGYDTLVQQEFITGIANSQVTVSMPEVTLNGLPPYRPDNVLQQEVEQILFDFTPFHIDLKGIKAYVLDSVLYLDGNISSSLRADIARDQVLGVDGLLEIKNNLVGDDQLAADLARALGNDPRTRDLPIGVYPRLGVVRLSGAVHNKSQKAVAEELAYKFPGVRSVTNELIVNPKIDILHVMASSEGGEAEDIVPGKYIRHTK